MLVGDKEPESKDIGIYANNSYTLSENNICSNLSRGIKIEYHGDVKIRKNLFDRNEIDVSAQEIEEAKLEKNTFVGTERIQLYIVNHSLADISRNNFINSLPNTAILIIGTFREDINAPYNYWDTASIEEAKRRIQDKRVDSQGSTANFKVIIEPIALQKIADAYPE